MLPKHVPLKTMTHADAVLKPFSPDPKGGGVVDPDAAPSRGFSSAVCHEHFCWTASTSSSQATWPVENGDFLGIWKHWMVILPFFLGPFWNPWPPLLLNPFFGFSRYESDISRLLARCNTFEDHGDLLPSLTIDITEHPKPKRPSLTSHASQDSQASQLGIFFWGWPKIQRGRIALARKKPWLPRSSNSCEVGSCESPPILTGKSRKMTANKSAVPWASVMPALETPQSLKQRLGFR